MCFPKTPLFIMTVVCLLFLNSVCFAGFDSSIRVLSFFLTQEPAGNTQNPGNAIFQIPQKKVVLELRPDFGFIYNKLDLSMKPRLRYQWAQLEVVRSSTNEETGDLFVNEWLARFMLSNRFFLSYGRENLQWGPGWLSSPSNPFFYYNGRLDSELEVPGKNFARIVYLPNMTSTISLISNFGRGRAEVSSGGESEKAHALKVDYTGETTYGGVILSHKEDGESNAGAFGGWTASNAMLLYGDLNVSTDNKTALLTGVSYTLEFGPTFALEYACRQDDSDSINHHIVMLQCHQNEIINRIDLLLRATANINDESMQFVANTDYMAGDNIQLFFNTSINSASDNGEFGGFIDYQVMAGLEYSF